jgi:predicted Zn finger-like uncharacterized protein
MLIVCPSCATSYQIDPVAVGPAGRNVRCARCKATWFVGDPKAAPEVSAFVDKVIAEAESQTPAARAAAPPPAATQPAADDFGAEAHETIASEPAAAGTPVAEPTTITDAPSLVPPLEHAPFPEPPAAERDIEEAESFAVRRQRLQTRRKQSRRSSRWTAIILVLVAFNVALLGARNEVVRHLPQTASLFAAIGLPVNLRNLKFENVRISKEIQDGASVLIVQGAIVSDASKPVEVPRLRFAARNAPGQEVYVWTAAPARSLLGPGERMQFNRQIPAPPADASDVMVRFVTPQDSGAK